MSLEKIPSHLVSPIEKLAEEFLGRFKSEGPVVRTLGREAEYPVVYTEDGRLGDSRDILKKLSLDPKWKKVADLPAQPEMLVALREGGRELCLEVGLGTIELITGPFQDLHEMKQGHEALMKEVLDVAGPMGLSLLGRGIQPLTEISPLIMAPKARYQVLHEVLGQSWLWFCVTASDQMHISIKKSEVLEAVNFGNLIAPILVAFCGNSSVYRSKSQQVCSLREVRMAEILPDEHRHGMILRPYRSIEEMIWDLAQKTCLVVRENGILKKYGNPMTRLIEEKGPDLEAFLLHEHYIWHSARARSAHSTLEFRPACQQPWAEHMALSSLATGLFEARAEVQKWLHQELGANFWSRMRAFHKDAIEKGLSADPPLVDFYSKILRFAQEGLRSRKRGEDVYLDVHFERLKDGMNPAQRGVQQLQDEGFPQFLAESIVPKI